MEIAHIYTRHTTPDKIYSGAMGENNELKLVGYRFTTKCFLFGWYKISYYVMTVIEQPKNSKAHVAGVMDIPYEYIITTPKWVDKAVSYLKQKLQKYGKQYRRNKVSADLQY